MPKAAAKGLCPNVKTLASLALSSSDARANMPLAVGVALVLVVVAVICINPLA